METTKSCSCQLPKEPLTRLSLRKTMMTESSKRRPTGVSPASAEAEVESGDFYSLPLGSPALYYSTSISNDGRNFGNRHPNVVYQSKCYTCNGLACSKKNGTCLIHGFCFVEYDRNPFNDCERCDPSVSSTTWTRIQELSCDPCLSSPCNRGLKCRSTSRTAFKCTEERTTVILIVGLAVAGFILAVIVAFIAIQCRTSSKMRNVTPSLTSYIHHLAISEVSEMENCEAAM